MARRIEKFRSDPELSAEIDNVVARTHLSRSDVLRDLVRRGLRDWSEEQKYLSRREHEMSLKAGAA